MDADDRKRIQGPCADGYHVPTTKEWGDAAENMSRSSSVSKNVLLLPMAGYRNSLHGDYVYHYYRGEDRVRIGTYWSSTPDKRTT